MLRDTSNCESSIYNIGTGHGYSVLDMVNACVKLNGVNVTYSIKPHKSGDIATYYCYPLKSKKLKIELGWETQYGIDEMLRNS